MKLSSFCSSLGGVGVRLSPLGTSATIWPIVPAPNGGWWWVWGNRWNDWQEKPNYSEKTCPVPFCPPQIPQDLTCTRTRAAAVGSWRLTAWATVRPYEGSSYKLTKDDLRKIKKSLHHKDQSPGWKMNVISGIQRELLANRRDVRFSGKVPSILSIDSRGHEGL
jgi:hypothetical protein